MPPAAQQPPTDFNPADIAPKVTKHEEDLVLIKGRLDALDEQFGSNEKIAETLFTAAKTQVRFEETFSYLFAKLAMTDAKIKEALLKLINEANDNKFKTFLGKFGTWILGGVTFILGVIVTVYITNHLGTPKP